VVIYLEETAAALNWLDTEINSWYQKLVTVRTPNIEAYNKQHRVGKPIPYLVAVIYELSDLMVGKPALAESLICKLAQSSPNVGIHLVIATQRPAPDVITTGLKASFPTRVCFNVVSHEDSKVVLDMEGAEKLLGRGDMLYMPTEASKPKRLQGSFVSDVEIERLVYFWGNQRQIEVSPVDFDEVAERPLSAQIAAPPDLLLEDAKRLAQEYKHISTSFLQRRLRIGYPRAARLMEALQQAGLVEAAQPERES